MIAQDGSSVAASVSLLSLASSHPPSPSPPSIAHHPSLPRDMSAPNATSSNFSSASNSLFEVSIVGLIPDSLFSLLVDKLNALSVGSSSFELAETVYSPIVLAEGAKAEDGLLRVRRVDGKRYVRACRMRPA